MPKRTDIKSILIIGAGPIVIGQACEFDYSGTQACKILREEGYRIILVNSNPATIMTDPEFADATYIEPITPDMVAKIIAKERPDALLPTMGGQTALNCAKALAENGTLDKFNVELIGARLESINKAEDRLLFGNAMAKIGLEVPKNAVVKSLEEARVAKEHIGLPVVIRPSFTMGGAGGGIAYNNEEFDQIILSGLDASPIGEVMIDESVLGWKEYEMEVVRDRADNCIIICSIENVDPMGVHTGDSITVAPALTLTDKEYQIMRDASFAVLREIGVDTGGSNVQFAVNPADGRMVVIEMNPRVSRSSALASKATGFPIAKVAAKLAVGYTLDEILNDVVSSPRRGEAGRGAETAHRYPLSKTLQNARELRKNLTDAETLLWSLLRKEQLGIKFRKQHPIGPYIADFACLNPKLIIELDGGQHNEETARKRDNARTAFLEQQGFKVIRFWNHDLLQKTESVMKSIYNTISEMDSPLPNPPPMGAGVQMPASFEPTIDYIVVKIPRFTFEKFPGTEPLLTTAMKSVGESMAMGRNFAEALQKALRSLETGLTGLNELPEINTIDTARAALSRPTPDRLLVAAQALRLGVSVEDIHAIAKYDPWFIRQLKDIVDIETKIKSSHWQTPQELSHIKSMGFCDKRIAELANTTPEAIAKLRDKHNIHPVFKRVDTCAAEFDSATPYMYSTYEGIGAECESEPTDKKKIIILGGGPNRIGQGIEFDYCCVHAAYALKEAGYETIMVNCNPETVSTDYDTSDRLYFEPLTAEDVLAIIRTEQKNGTLHGVIVQFGGQTPLKLARALEAAGVPIIGTSPDSIDLAEDRDRFRTLVNQLGLKQPKSAIGRTTKEIMEQAASVGYPLLVRPSYVLGGRAMAIKYDEASLAAYVDELTKNFGDGPILIDSYLQDAIELDVDALSDGTDVFVAGIMQHIEEAGIHSGDSACSLPPYSLDPSLLIAIREQTKKLAHGLKVIGLMNIQFAIKDGEIYLIEVNPRASRTVPFVAKSIGIPIAKIAARIMAGEKLASFKLGDHKIPQHVCVKEAVFPFARFPGVDVILGPEMKSTGEAMGIDSDFGRAFAKSQLSAGGTLPDSGCVFISVKESDKENATQLARELTSLGFSITATRGTAAHLEKAGLTVKTVNKVREGRPHVVDMMKDNAIALVINTTDGAQALTDSFSIRRTALLNKLPYYTTIAGARAVIQAIGSIRQGQALDVKSLQDYFK